MSQTSVQSWGGAAGGREAHPRLLRTGPPFKQILCHDLRDIKRNLRCSAQDEEVSRGNRREGKVPVQKGWRPERASASMSRLANSSVLPEARPRARRVICTPVSCNRLAM